MANGYSTSTMSSTITQSPVTSQVIPSNTMVGGVMTGGSMPTTGGNKSLELRAISMDPSNIMSSQMDKISSLNYVKSNSDSYVRNLANQNAMSNDMFYFAALNSRENQGSFFYANENSLNSKESLIFDNQRILMQDVAINNALERSSNVINSTFSNRININNEDRILPISERLLNNNTIARGILVPGSRFAYPSSRGTTSVPLGRNQQYQFVGRHSYPSVR